MTDSTQQAEQPRSYWRSPGESLEGRFPDQLDAIHSALMADVRQQPEYVTNSHRITAIGAYSEGAEHALESVRLRGYEETGIAELRKRLTILAEVYKIKAQSLTNPRESAWCYAFVVELDAALALAGTS